MIFLLINGVNAGTVVLIIGGEIELFKGGGTYALMAPYVLGVFV